jgi:hypothetical protein
MAPLTPLLATPLLAQLSETRARLQQFERALTMTFGLLHDLLERLESKLGPGFLSPELARLAEGTSSGREEVAEIDALIKQGQQPKAARLVRELGGITWDEALALIARWHSYTVEQRLRWVQLARWLKMMSSPATPPRTEE